MLESWDDGELEVEGFCTEIETCAGSAAGDGICANVGKAADKPISEKKTKRILSRALAIVEYVHSLSERPVDGNRFRRDSDSLGFWSFGVSERATT
ncbi:MAG: hypothetical protein ACYDCD_13845 [Candidatus Acidiferrales bacterium]